MASNGEKLAKGLSTQGSVSITLGILDIVSFSIMSRLLSERDFGYYAAAVAISSIFSALADTGVGAAIVQRKHVTKQYINNAFTICLGVGIFVSGLLFLFAGLLAKLFVDESMISPLRFFSVSILFHCLASVNLSILQKNCDFWKMGIANIFSLIITTVVAVILALAGMGYYAIISKVVLASFLTFLISKILARTSYSLAFDKTIAKEIVGYGGWLMLSSIFRNVAHQIDRLLMPRLFSVDTLGAYTRPKEFMYSITQKINGILDVVLFPHLSSIQDEKEKMKQSFLTSIFLFGICGISLNMLFIYNSELLILIFFGEKWLNVISLFKILSVYPLFLFWGRMGDVFLRSLGLTKYQFFLRTTQLFTSLIAVLLVYKLGIESVAIAVIISYVIVMSIKILFISRYVGVKIKEVIYTAIKTMKMLLYYIPSFIILDSFLPGTSLGYVAKTIFFIFITISLFFIFPNSIGGYYAGSVHPVIVCYLKKLQNKL